MMSIPYYPSMNYLFYGASLSLISKLGANIESYQSARRLLYSEAGSLIRQRPGYHCTHLLYIQYSVCTSGCLAKKQGQPYAMSVGVRGFIWLYGYKEWCTNEGGEHSYGFRYGYFKSGIQYRVVRIHIITQRILQYVHLATVHIWLAQCKLFAACKLAMQLLVEKYIVECLHV